MTESKTFRVSRSTQSPHPFFLELEQEGGEFKKVGPFHAKPKVPGTLILDLVASGSLGAEWQAAALRKFFDQAIVDGDKDEFFKVLDESEPEVDFEQLSEISKWLVELYGENPTGPASQS